MEKKLISVIIPVYNVAEYLPKCLETVCGQTYDNLEIILIDDGSTDGSGKICDEWRLRDERIRVIHKENGGVSSARNEGLKVASGDLIGFVDSDDWLEPDMYEKLVKGIEGADAACCGYVDYPYGEGVPVEKGIKPVASDNIEDAYEAIYERNGYFTSVWNKLFRKEKIYRNGRLLFFDTSISVGEDELWLIRLLNRCTCVSFVHEALYHWRPRKGSATSFDKVTEKQLSVFKAKKKAMAIMPKSESLRKLAESVMYNDCFLMLVSSYCAGDYKTAGYVSRKLNPVRKSWLKSQNVPLMRKVKVMVIEAEMKLRLPAKAVAFTNNIKRNRLQ